MSKFEGRKKPGVRKPSFGFSGIAKTPQGLRRNIDRELEVPFHQRTNCQDNEMVPNMRIYFALSLLGLVTIGCDNQSSTDQKALDVLLTKSTISQIEERQMKQTNWISGPDVQKFLASLGATNRARASGSKSQFQARFIMLSGKAEICSIELYEDGSWEFGSYVFRLRN